MDDGVEDVMKEHKKKMLWLDWEKQKLAQSMGGASSEPLSAKAAASVHLPDSWTFDDKDDKKKKSK